MLRSVVRLYGTRFGVGMKKAILGFMVASMLAGCSTAGGMYKSGDVQNGEFSPGRTLLSVLAVAAAVAVVKNGGGGGGGYGSGYAWDYQPGNGQWVCRNKSNGQYAYEYNCAGVPKVDYWPNN